MQWRDPIGVHSKYIIQQAKLQKLIIFIKKTKIFNLKFAGVLYFYLIALNALKSINQTEVMGEQ